MNSYNPFEDLIDMLREEGSVKYEIDRPLDEENGEWWLDLIFDEINLEVVWKRSFGFGLWTSSDSGFTKPDETHANVLLAYNRIIEILKPEAGVEE